MPILQSRRLGSYITLIAEEKLRREKERALEGRAPSVQSSDKKLHTHPNNSLGRTGHMHPPPQTTRKSGSTIYHVSGGQTKTFVERRTTITWTITSKASAPFQWAYRLEQVETGVGRSRAWTRELRNPTSFFCPGPIWSFILWNFRFKLSYGLNKLLASAMEI